MALLLMEAYLKRVPPEVIERRQREDRERFERSLARARDRLQGVPIKVSPAELLAAYRNDPIGADLEYGETEMGAAVGR
jgi:hypothetical protein